MKTIAALYKIIKFILKHPLNSHQSFNSIAKFFFWQVGVRVLKRKIIIDWVDDSKFITGVGETGLTGNIYTGLMEYEDMLFLLHALQPSDTFIDVGANIGAYTILASKVVQSNSIAFEPLPETVERLKDQIYINRLVDKVDVRNIGIGDKKDSLFFTNNNDTVNKVSLKGDVENTTSVEVSTLDSELDQNSSYFFKIDVEGFEYNVLEGALKILSTKKVVAIIIELNGSGDEFGHSNEKTHNKLLSFDYIPVAYEPKTRTLIKLNNYNKNGGNTIYVMDLELIQDYCTSSPKRIIHTAFDVKI